MCHFQEIFTLEMKMNHGCILKKSNYNIKLFNSTQEVAPKENKNLNNTFCNFRVKNLNHVFYNDGLNSKWVQ